jgi:hypothetical protein
MVVTEVVSVFTAAIVLAGIAYAIANGGQTANILGTSLGGFANVIRASTGR